MHHVNQPVSPTYQHASRNQFAPATGSSGLMAADRASPSSGVTGLPGRGMPVVMRLSPTGVPTYYYYNNPQHPTTASSPLAVSSSGSSPRSGTQSPVLGSAPNSPNPSHHRQLPHPPSNPFHYYHHHHQQQQQQQQQHQQQQQQVQYAAHVSGHGSSLQHHYNLQIPASSAILQQSHCFASPPDTPSPPRTPPPAHPMVQSPIGTYYPPPQLTNQRQVTSPQQQPYRYPTRTSAASGTSAVAIDNKIEQAMDLVKSHLMFAVREEVEVLKEKIAELMERINQLEVENSILKAHASTETLAQLGGGGAGGGGQAVVPPAASMQMQAQGQQQAS